jgi:hypothetical protein
VVHRSAASIGGQVDLGRVVASGNGQTRESVAGALARTVNPAATNAVSTASTSRSTSSAGRPEEVEVLVARWTMGVATSAAPPASANPSASW